MAYVYKHSKWGWYLVIRLASGNRTQIYLGEMPKSRAETIARRVDELNRTNAVGLQPDPQIANWLSCCPPEFLAKLERVHLLRLWRRPSDIALMAWWDSYLESRTDLKLGTLRGFKTARNHIANAFGSMSLAELTPAMTKQFARDLLACGMSAAHASKITARLGQICRAAIDAGKLVDDPCAGVSIPAKIDETRRFYIPVEMAKLVIEHMPHAEGRALFALARWGGCRIPNEPLALEWSMIDWHARRISIPRATKTGARVFPLFPEIDKELTALDAETPEGTQFVFNRGRASAKTEWRRWIIHAIKDAKLTPWRDVWHNLRRSAVTDAQIKGIPTYVSNAWFGHSARVAEKHYLMVTPGQWAAAADSGISPTSQPSPKPLRRAK